MAFRAVYRRGRWARGQRMSIGALPTRSDEARVGLRTKHGLKGAVVRNRLKRQARTALAGCRFKPGWDVVIVLNPPTSPATLVVMKRELHQLCARLGITHD